MITRRAAALGFAIALGAAGCSGSESDAIDAAETPTVATSSERPSTDSAVSTTATAPPSTVPTTPTTADAIPATEVLRVGAEVLADDDFALLRGKRVGAIVNQTSLVDGRRLIDLIAEHHDIDLVRLFAPEHGIDGSLAAGIELADSVDSSTGVPIASLYGTTRQPTAAMFDDLDVVVFDLQDVGSRSYTYVSTMGLAMQTAAATQTSFIVLDRPNPAGGDRFGGIVLEPAQTSFIGMYPLPSVHGLTVGEIATMIIEQAWLPGVDELDLTVVPMQGWSRDRRWNDLDRTWVAPSPRLPTADIALLYTGMVLLAGTSISDGSGTSTPFALAGAPFVESGDDLAAALEAYRLPGVRFEATTFTPASIPGVSPSPLHEGIPLEGVRIVVTDHATIDPFGIAIHVLVACQAMLETEESIVVDPASFDLVAGSPELRRWIERGDTAEAILDRLHPSLDGFEQQRDSVLLYD